MLPLRNLILAIAVATSLLHTLCAAEPTPAQLDHFEKFIRPVLIEHCGKCHGEPAKGKSARGGLRLDRRQFVLDGGDTGPAVVPGEPNKSKLMEAMRYKNTDLLMPPKGALPDAVIRDFEQWVKDGAAWPAAAEAPAKPIEFDLVDRKKKHWAWQPLKPGTPVDASSKVDDLLARKRTERQTEPAASTQRLTWLRRVTFALTGLPPTLEQIRTFEADTSPNAFETCVDRLLATPQFGERWARHWLDLVRYAESRGHEFEPDISNATEYRDYVIRAMNEDVPYDQFVREHLAGDALPTPRLHAKTGANESAVGAGFWHLGEEVHSPVDIRQDQADRFDNRIDVATKTFLGLTVACARCHDHKFDAIGTNDYYALFGLLQGSTYRQLRPDGWKQNREVQKQLESLRHDTFAKHRVEANAKPDAKLESWLARASVVLDFAKLQPGLWLPDDVSFGTAPVTSGTLRVRNGKLRIEPYTAAVFDSFWANLKLAPGAMPDYGPLGRVPRAGFSIRTPDVLLGKKHLHYLVRGGGMAYAAVGQHTIIAGPLHGALIHVFNDSEEYRWVSHDVSGSVGQRLHVELTADPRTDFAVAMIVQSDDASPPFPTLESPPTPTRDITEYLRKEKSLAEKVVWESRQVLSMWDGPAVATPVFIRGNPRTPGNEIPPRNLEALNGVAALKQGRVELANQWTDPARNPLVPRVVVNRVWHQLFGRGLVPTCDNFGVLGEAPTHPDLLDGLATSLVNDGWSLKRLIRKLVLTQAYRLSSTPHVEALKHDPKNETWHSFPVRRLEGEAIRDAMLSISGRLDATLFGPSVPIHLTPFLDGRGRPASGPIDGQGRRSLYLAVRRNFLSPFLQVFDTPSPFSTVGRRQVSNVPAQALTLLNDPFVHEQAELWAKKILAEPGSTEERVKRMYLAAFGRPATAAEVTTCVNFIGDKTDDRNQWADLAHTLFNVKEFVFVK